MSTTFLIPILLIAFVLWRVYSRLRRMIGRQLMRRGRLIFTLILWPLLIVAIGISSRGDLRLAEALAAGVAVGGALAVLGLRLTRFEPTASGFFYTPNAHIGIALTLLLFGRILFRVYQGYSSIENGHRQAPDFGQSPLTLVMFGLLAGYYFCYALGLLQKHAQLSIPQAAPAPGLADVDPTTRTPT